MTDGNGDWKWSSIDSMLPMIIKLIIAATLPPSTSSVTASAGCWWTADRKFSMKSKVCNELYTSYKLKFCSYEDEYVYICSPKSIKNSLAFRKESIHQHVNDGEYVAYSSKP
ncbi:hypothetical protein V6N11_034186 [Hibiscus sabdariffa]|uniref:Uncharacterized protein n=1 Tax=Hibiscus sabdariffa TaxID=183260 RepID=A0ABR2S2K7_9ROSI